MKVYGVLGVQTDYLSETSQIKIKPIIEKLFSEICLAGVTKREAYGIAANLLTKVGSHIRDAEKTELFCMSVENRGDKT